MGEKGDDKVRAPRVVFVDDHPDDRLLAHREVLRVLPNARISNVNSVAELESVLSSGDFDAIVTDYYIGWIDGLEVLRRAKAASPDCPVLMFTGTGDEEIAVEAMKRGLDDYILKRPVPSPKLGLALQRVLALATERRERLRSAAATEGALLESRAFSESLLENANVLVVGLDRSLHVVVFNRTAEEVTGWSRQEVMGQSWLDRVVPPEYSAEVERNLQHLAESGEAGTFEYSVVSRTGENRQVVWRSGVIRLAQRVTGTLSFGMDVTETRRMERHIQQAAKMESLGRFAAGIAHDFNNVLTIIMSHATHIEAELPASHPVRRRVAAIQTAADRAAALTRQILAFTRQQVMQRKVIDLAQLVAGMEDMLRRAAGEEVSLTTSLGSGPRRVYADHTQIEQVLMNLVVNARDAMPSGGTLRIEVRNVDLDGTAGRSWPVDVPAGPYVLLSVSDTGEGMDAETQARVFEPFFTTKADGKGTGLGLATVFGIVKQSKGFVWVYSEPGGGTTFKVYLPAVNEPLSEESTVHSMASANGGGETILVAEDDPGLLEITREVLENNGYTVLPASGGDEALRIAAEHTEPIALLLSDLVMGGLGGHALAKRLGQSRPQTRVLFMSGYTADSLHQQGAPEEAMPILEKPFHAEALLRRVREVLDAPDPEPKPS